MSCVGAISQLVAVGHHEKYLVNSPNITFWRFRHMRHTNFALESCIQQWSGGSSGLGDKTSLRVNRQGDLVYWMYVNIQLPGLANVVNQHNSCYYGHEVVANEEEVCRWGAAADVVAANDGCNGTSQIPRYTNAVGQYAIRQAYVTVGGQTLDTVYADYLYMWEELSGKPGKKLGEMVGKAKTKSLAEHWSKFDRTLYVPLPFFFTMTSGTVLPLVSLQFHDVKVYCEFNSLQDCIVNYQACFDGAPTRTVIRPPLQNGRLAPIQKNDALSDIQPNDIKTSLEICYVYLDVDERAKFAEGAFEQLMTEVQCLETTATNQHQRIRLDFNHSIIELIWAVRKESSSNANDHFNYSGVTEPVTGANRDPITVCTLKLNNQKRFEAQEGRYFRLVQPYQHHTNIPEAFVYCYSFALHPEDVQPSGQCNFSRIDNATFECQLDPNLFRNNANLGGGPDGEDYSGQTVDVIIFARNWNVLRFKHGLGGKAFAN